MALPGRDEYSDPEFWDHLVQRDPVAARAQATAVLDADEPPGAAVAALAQAAVARSLFETGRLDDALRAARSALDASAAAPLEVRSPVSLSATVILAEAGQIDEALTSLEELATVSDGAQRAKFRLQIAYLLQHAGRLNEALAEYDRSERLFVTLDDQRDRSRVHLNRGVVLLQQGRLKEAVSDFDAAESLAADTGMAIVQAQAVANHAVLLGRARRLADSLTEFDRAATLFSAAGDPHRPVAIMSIDRAEVMMHSGLVSDAVQAGRAAIASIAPTGNIVLLGDAYLMTARAELAAGDVRRAQISADRAAEIFTGSGRADMAPHARSIVVQAVLAGAREAEPVEQQLADAIPVTGALRAAGWTNQADELAVARIRAARRWGLLEQVRGDLERLRIGLTDGRRDTALAGWWAQAVSRLAAGDHDGAELACHGGLDVLDGIVAEAPTLEARSAAMRMGSDLSQVLIEVAIARGDADTVLGAAEGTRARALHDELVANERHRPLTSEGAERLRSELAVRLQDRTLVEWIVVDDRIWAVVFDAGGSRLVDVGDRTRITQASDRVLMWLDLAAAEPDESSERAARASRLLDEMLIAPLDLPTDGGVTMVPVDLLHRIPWSGLPSFAGRPVSMTPNAQVWLEADRRASGRVRSVGLVLGPDLAGDDIERRAIEQWYAGAAVASGVGASAATVRSMFAGSDLVQIAAHGTFRSDHPLLSTLRLNDGEATLYDAIPEGVRAKLVVLSSCEGGAQGTADGSEVLGMSAVLLARGAAAVVAPLTAVRDLECAEFVVDVHRELAGGEPVACAVANVRRRWLADDDLSRWAVASSFSCFGSGAVQVTV